MEILTSGVPLCTICKIVHASLVDLQAEINLNWVESTEAKIAFKTLKLAVAREFSYLDQVSSDLMVVTSSVVIVGYVQPVTTDFHDLSSKALI